MLRSHGCIIIHCIGPGQLQSGPLSIHSFSHSSITVALLSTYSVPCTALDLGHSIRQEANRWSLRGGHTPRESEQR